MKYLLSAILAAGFLTAGFGPSSEASAEGWRRCRVVKVCNWHNGHRHCQLRRICRHRHHHH